jgi:hypothetical protein
MAVGAVCCELVSDFPAIREKYRDFLALLTLFQDDFGYFVSLINGLVPPS